MKIKYNINNIINIKMSRYTRIMINHKSIVDYRQFESWENQYTEYKLIEEEFIFALNVAQNKKLLLEQPPPYENPPPYKKKSILSIFCIK
jgi:hypothetical protein